MTASSVHGASARNRERWLAPAIFVACLAVPSACRSVVGIEDRPAQPADAGDAQQKSHAQPDAGEDALDPCPPCDPPDASSHPPCHEVQRGFVWQEPGAQLPPIAPWGGPVFTRMDQGWLGVWRSNERRAIATVPITDLGDMKIPDPPIALPDGAEATDLALAASGDRVFVGVTRQMPDERWAVDIHVVGLAGQAMQQGNTLLASSPYDPIVVAGIAAAPQANRLVVVTRRAGFAGIAAQATAHLFQADPLVRLVQLPLGGTYQADVAWSSQAQRFGIAYLTDETVTSGRMTLVDAGFSDPVDVEFTGDQHWPMADASLFDLSVAAAGSSFVVAWTDRFEATQAAHDPIEDDLDVRAIAVDAATLEVTPPGGIAVSGEESMQRTYVQVAHDGTSTLVSWLEPSPSSLTLRVRRFDANLQPIGGATEPFAEGEVFRGPFGVAAAARNDYGFMAAMGDGSVHFVRMGCTNP